MARAQELLTAALRLPVDERAALAQQRLESIDGHGFEDPEIAEAWAQEIAVRLEASTLGAGTTSWQELELELVVAEHQHGG